MASDPTRPAPPLACVVGAIPPELRSPHRDLTRRLFEEAARSRERLTDGYVFRFDPAELEPVARWIAAERLCCPFLEFDLTATGGAPLQLRVRGPAGAPELIEAEILSGSPATRMQP